MPSNGLRNFVTHRTYYVSSSFFYPFICVVHKIQCSEIRCFEAFYLAGLIIPYPLFGSFRLISHLSIRYNWSSASLPIQAPFLSLSTSVCPFSWKISYWNIFVWKFASTLKVSFWNPWSKGCAKTRNKN